jgi:hypothetical protein
LRLAHHVPRRLRQWIKVQRRLRRRVKVRRRLGAQATTCW